MEMAISLPTMGTATVKANSRLSGDKAVNSPFGEILELTLENAPVIKEKATTEETFSQAALSAIFALLQPAMTNVPTASAVIKNTVEAPQPGPVTLETTGIKLLNTTPGTPIHGQSFSIETVEEQIDDKHTQQMSLGLTNVNQGSILTNLHVHNKKTDILIMNGAVAHNQEIDTHKKQDKDLLTQLPSRVAVQIQQQENVTQHVAENMNKLLSSESKATTINVQQSANNAITLGSSQKPAEEWQFNGSGHQGEQNYQIEAASGKNDSSVSNALFQTIMEKQPFLKPAEAISSHSQQPQAVIADKYEVAAQIVEHAKLITRPQNTEMIIKLKPEHLGELTFKIAIEQGVVTATFHSNNPDVRTTIEATLPQLKQDLSTQGIKLDNVGVFAGMDQFLSGEHRGGQQYEQSIIQHSRKHDDNFCEMVTEVLHHSSPVTNDGGIDFRV